ncbi:restriction endonuclease subunit S [Arthrobacter citreus]|uniref:restriction endonuclease subunit S n=1 Tax=Arthrobacter TaxID=1663 RepID=UPI00126526BA|nr:restriction endonuclease subunit S [Arthrobacter gandavensis]
MTDQTCLKDYLSFRNGKTSPARSNQGTFPVYGSNGQIGYAEESNASGPLIVIGRVGSYCGSLYYSGEDAWVTDNAIVCTPIGSTDARYWYYALQTLDLNGRSSGSGQPLLNQGVLGSIPFGAPEKQERMAIAEVLGALDDKIAANTKLVHGLDELFSAHWQALSQPESGTQCRLNSLVADIFAGDWGSSEKTATHPEEVLCIRGADLPSLQTSGSGKMPIRFLKPTSLKRRELHVGDIVMEASGGSPTQSTGRAALITDSLLSRFDVPLSSSNFCKALRMKDSKNAFLVYGHLRNSWERGEFFQYENGTTGIKNLALTNYFNDKEIRLPDDHRLQSFNDLSVEIFKKMQAAGQESDILAVTRDALLPQLMSGKLRVRDIENTMGEMV